jgi:serine/threonine protein kinase
MFHTEEQLHTHHHQKQQQQLVEIECPALMASDSSCGVITRLQSIQTPVMVAGIFRNYKYGAIRWQFTNTSFSTTSLGTTNTSHPDEIQKPSKDSSLLLKSISSLHKRKQMHRYPFFGSTMHACPNNGVSRSVQKRRQKQSMKLIIESHLGSGVYGVVMGGSLSGWPANNGHAVHPLHSGVPKGASASPDGGEFKKVAIKFTECDDFFERESSISLLVHEYLYKTGKCPYVWNSADAFILHLNDNNESGGDNDDTNEDCDDINASRRPTKQLSAKHGATNKKRKTELLLNHLCSSTTNGLKKNNLKQKFSTIFSPIFATNKDDDDENKKNMETSRGTHATNAPTVTSHPLMLGCTAVEWVDGKTGAWLLQNVPLQAGDWLSFAFQLFYVLAALHEGIPGHKILHADIRLENVLFAPTQRKDCIIINETTFDPYRTQQFLQRMALKIIDYSISFLQRRRIAESDSPCYYTVSTVHYRAPELFFFTPNQPVVYTEACDVWSMGILLFLLAHAPQKNSSEVWKSIVQCNGVKMESAHMEAIEELTLFLDRIEARGYMVEEFADDDDDSGVPERFQEQIRIHGTALNFVDKNQSSSLAFYIWSLVHVLGFYGMEKDFFWNESPVWRKVRSLRAATSPALQKNIPPNMDMVKQKIGSEAFELLRAALSWNPAERPSARSLLEHACFKQLYFASAFSTKQDANYQCQPTQKPFTSLTHWLQLSSTANNNGDDKNGEKDNIVTWKL